MTRLLCGCSILPFLAMSFVRADDNDLVRKRLDVAKSNYESEVEKYQAAVKQWFDGREDTARKAGNTTLVQQIKTERETFEAKGDLPATAPVTLKQKITVPQAALVAAYQNAIKAYLQEKKDDRALVLEKELEEFKKGFRVTIEPPPDILAKGSLLQGVRWVDPANKVKIELVVTERNREAFRGELRLYGPQGMFKSYAVTGTSTTSKNGPIRFRTEKKGNFQQDFVGKFTGGVAEMRFSGITIDGKPIQGNARLNAD